MKKFLVISIISFLVIACSRQDLTFTTFPEIMAIPPGYPDIQAPADNVYTLARWTLGKRLFHDPIMSSDKSISCASCHNQVNAFSDHVSLSEGVHKRLNTLNTPTLTNIAYNPYFTSAGGVSTLEKHVLVPVQEHNEFDFNMLLIVERIKDDPTYVELSKQSYDRLPDAYVITRAIACYERSLLSFESEFDKYNMGKTDAMGVSAKRGMDLFYSDKTQCSSCHSGINFTDYSFKNNGLYKDYQEEGRLKLTGNEEDRGLFKVPTLRNIERTAPYMHDGSMADLNSVIRHYESGGLPHKNRSEHIRPFSLTGDERKDLIQFLKSLTDENFVSNPIFNNK